jgi:hypothetical protein
MDFSNPNIFQIVNIQNVAILGRKTSFGHFRELS